MSALDFISRTGETSIAGAERWHLHHLATAAAMPAWDLDGFDALDQAATIIGMSTEPPDSYLRADLKAAQGRQRLYLTEWARHEDRVADTHFLNKLRTKLKIGEMAFIVAGRRLEASNVMLNTALAVGSDPIRVAAKLAGWEHCWVAGCDRDWLAAVVEAGRETGIYRADAGWEQLVEFLRADDTSPAVTSHSTGSSFPNPDIAEWKPPPLPDSWRPSWMDDAEWEQCSDSERAETRAEHAYDQWYDLPDGQRFDLAMEGLRQRRPWARLGPDTLGKYHFDQPVTIFHLMGADRASRVREICEGRTSNA